MAVDVRPVDAPASTAFSAIASPSTQTTAIATDRARAIDFQQNDAAFVTSLLASIAAHAADAFSDKTTIVGALNSAQAELAPKATGPSRTSQGSKDVHEATSSFAATVAKAALPHSADFPTTTVTKAVATYAGDVWKNAA